MAAAASDNAAARMVQYLGLVTVVGVTVVTLPVLLFTPDLIEFFFGGSFEGATNVARILLVAGAVLSTNRVLAAILQARGRPLVAAEGEFIGLIVTVGALATLLPLLGLVGAALASLLAYSAGAAWNVRRVAQSVPLREART